MLRLCAIIFILLSFNKSFGKDVKKEFNKSNFCQTNSQYFLKNLNENIYPEEIIIKTNKTKSWYIDLIKSFYSTPRSNWKIDRDYKKYKSAKIIINYGENIICKFKGKVKIHGGRKDHIDLKTLNSSIRIKIFDGHINHSRHFALMLPQTKLNDNEIFVTNLLHKIGIISPETFYTNVKFNNNNSIKMIFQDMDYTEILRRNSRADGIVIAENKTKNNEFNLTRVLNTEKQVMGSGWKNNRLYLLNALDKTNYLFLNEKFYRQKNILSNKENYFLNKNKFKDFYLLMFAVNGLHGYQFGDRRYYYNLILDQIEPIYYDWKSNVLENNFKSIPNEQLNFKIDEKHIQLLINKIRKLNLIEFKTDLKEKGLELSDKKLNNTIIKIIDNLKSINTKKLKDNKKISNFEFNYKNKLLFHVNKNTYEICNNKFECKKIDISEKIEKEIFQEHEVKYNNDIVKFIRTNKNYFKSNILPEKKSINLMSKVNLDNETTLYFNQYTNVNFENNTINIDYLNGNARAFFIGGFIENKSININSFENFKKNKNISDNLIPYCTIFYHTILKDVKINANNLNCQKAIRFIKTSGNIYDLYVKNSEGDAVSAESSKLDIERITVENSNDDCLDIEVGEYNFKNLYLKNCKDKALQTKMKSNIKVNKLIISDSTYGISILDSSIVKIDSANISTEKECLIAYRENDSYYGSMAEINKKFICNKKNYLYDKSSLIKINDF